VEVVEGALDADDGGQHALGVGQQRGAGDGRPQGPLRPVDQRDAGVALQAGELLGDGRLGVSEDVRRRRDRAELRHEGEGAEAGDVTDGHEENLLLIEGDSVALLIARVEARAAPSTAGEGSFDDGDDAGAGAPRATRSVRARARGSGSSGTR
jgi:hypothetical protein